MDKQGFGRLKRSVATESALSVVVPSFFLLPGGGAKNLRGEPLSEMER